MKSPTVLLQPLLDDLGSRCGTSTTQDLKTILRRVDAEGLSFLTITLADFGRDFEKSLDQGHVAIEQFSSFRRTAGLPSFLKGFLSQVFDSKSGLLLDVPSVEAIRAVRQITLMWAKIALPCSAKRTERAFHGYIETEKEVRQFDLAWTTDSYSRFQRIGRLLWSSYFASVDNHLHAHGVLPRHGPGATAERLRSNRKYVQKLWTSRLESVFPHWEYLTPSDSPSNLEWLEDVTILAPEHEIPVRVITVPKTLKTPRIIAIEPTAMQYMQQGILEVMVQKMPDDDFARNFVQFDSQRHNQHLAREGSSKGELATLDLSEASDRVSNQHVRALLENHAALRNAVDSTRSRKADVLSPGGLRETIRLAKFASMGSALCFPMEALVFTTVLFVGIERENGRPLTKEDVRSFFGRVRVYGDDIIVPVEYVHSVIRELEAFGFRVNSNKSFWTGKFRESCGKDYYAGHDVTVVRLRQLIPESRQDAESVISTIAFRNHMFHRGYERVVIALDRILERIIPFPVVDWYYDAELGDYISNSPILGRHDYGPSQAEGYDSHLHVPLVKGVVVDSRLPASPLDGLGALMKHFLRRGVQPFEDKMHLQRSGRPDSVRIKVRWAPPY